MKQVSVYITLHLKADSPEELSALTIQAQLQWGIVADFFDFSQTKDGKYICWYKVPYPKYVEAMSGEA